MAPSARPRSRMPSASTSARPCSRANWLVGGPVRRRREARHEAHDAAVEDGEARHRTARSLRRELVPKERRAPSVRHTVRHLPAIRALPAAAAPRTTLGPHRFAESDANAPRCGERIALLGSVESRHSWQFRPCADTNWARHLGHWRRRLDIRMGSAARCRIAGHHQAGPRPRHQLDRHRRRVRARSRRARGGESPARDAATRRPYVLDDLRPRLGRARERVTQLPAGVDSARGRSQPSAARHRPLRSLSVWLAGLAQ